jgi:hypothetical protein
LKFARTGVLPINDVTTDSIAPVIVLTSVFVVVAEPLEEELFELRVAVLNERTAEPLTPFGEQPTKLGADSLTAVHEAMLNAIASISN